MKKIIMFLSPALFIFPSLLFADSQEVKITTYYPAPYGEYEQIKLEEQSSLPTASWANEGTLMYKGGTTNKLYYSNGQKWVAQSGGGSFCEGKSYYGIIPVTSGDFHPACSVEIGSTTDPTAYKSGYLLTLQGHSTSGYVRITVDDQNAYDPGGLLNGAMSMNMFLRFEKYLKIEARLADWNKEFGVFYSYCLD